MARLCSVLSLLLTVCAVNSYRDDYLISTTANINNVMFGFDFFKYISYGQKNVFFSPLSISTAMSQVYVGARGKTRTDLGIQGWIVLDALKLDIPQIYHKLLTHLRSNSSYTLEIANALITQANYPILEEYKQILRRNYDSLVKEVDFVKENDKAVHVVNSWVNEKTHGKISKLVDSLDTATRMVLLNAVYFKGLWATQFNSNKTVKQPFYSDGGETVTHVPMMRLHDNFPYADYPHRQYKVLQLPYEGKNVSMLIVLPYEVDGVDRLKKISTSTFSEFFNDFRETKVNITLPRFKLEYSRQLNEDFKKFGYGSLFGPDADLSGITGSRNLYVDQVVHKAVIEVNEQGSEAAAVTGVIVEVSAILNPRVGEFHANHPFVFYIVDNRSKLVLFMGSVDKL